MKVFAYIRVSTAAQSCESQKYEISEYCRKTGIIVNSWVCESVSGTVPTENRRLGRVIKGMNSGDLLICSEISRLGRNMLMIMGVLNECAKKGIGILTIKDNFNLSDSINSKIIAFAFALASEIERNLISQRTREALAAKKAEGVRLGRPPGPSATYKRFCENAHEIMEMRGKGISICAIAKKYQMHANTLTRYIRDSHL